MRIVSLWITFLSFVPCAAMLNPVHPTETAVGLLDPSLNLVQKISSSGPCHRVITLPKEIQYPPTLSLKIKCTKGEDVFQKTSFRVNAFYLLVDDLNFMLLEPYTENGQSFYFKVDDKKCAKTSSATNNIEACPIIKKLID